MNGKEQWESGTMAKTLARNPKCRASFETNSRIPVKRLYTPEDATGGYEERLGYPGQYPFTRGIQSTICRRRFRTMRQYAGFATAEESNKWYRYLLEQGQTGLSIAFDLSTQIDYGPDDPMAHGEVGKVGVAIDSLADMEVLFQGIPLDRVNSSVTINAPTAVLLTSYIVAAEKQGVPTSALKGTIQNDILKEYAARGTYIFPSAPSMRLITNTFEFYSQNVPKWNTISVFGYHTRRAGSTAAQEIAFTPTDGIVYVEAALEAGMDIDEFAGRFPSFFNAHNNLLEEVAKYQAARRLWAKIMKECFHVKKDHSTMLRFHTQIGGFILTAQQPDNNTMRVAIQTLTAVSGGTQPLHINSRDEALTPPTEDPVRTAPRTQQIVAYESGVADSINPLGGSYYAECMTDEPQATAKAYIEKIDAMGGAVKAIEQGCIRREITESFYQYQCQVESGEQIMVGVNKFAIEEPSVKGLPHIDAPVAVNQIKKPQEMKVVRDNVLVRQRLDVLRTAAENSDNLMSYIPDYARVYYTEGEACGELCKVFGEYRPTEML